VGIKTNGVLTFKAVVALSLILAIFSTCSEKSTITNPYDQTSPLMLKIDFTNASLLNLIDRIVLTVSSKTDTVQTDLTPQHGQISGSVEVPAGQNNLTVEALDEQGKVVYRGDTTVTVIGGSTTRLSISLAPEVFLLKLSPTYNEVDRFQTFVLDVKLYNVQEFADDLFGISFRVEFDPEHLYCTGADSGGFLGPPDPTFFYGRIDSLVGYVAVGYTKIYGSSYSVSDSGTLATINFEARVTDAVVNLIINKETLTLYDSVGEREDWKESVYVHNAQVLIE
jgi:hypothetical protein